MYKRFLSFTLLLLVLVACETTISEPRSDTESILNNESMESSITAEPVVVETEDLFSEEAPSRTISMILPAKGEFTQKHRPEHAGWDIANSEKPPVYAAAEGRVAEVGVSGWNEGKGNFVLIDHGDGIESLYAHLDTISVEVGQTVLQGDEIAIMGNTGRVYGEDGIHLHFGVTVDGVQFSPEYFVEDLEGLGVFDS
jgi:murein DD-endopeptidase MepM/ murein hydrolase activator NlpD